MLQDTMAQTVTDTDWETKFSYGQKLPTHQLQTQMVIDTDLEMNLPLHEQQHFSPAGHHIPADHHNPADHPTQRITQPSG